MFEHLFRWAPRNEVVVFRGSRYEYEEGVEKIVEYIRAHREDIERYMYEVMKIEKCHQDRIHIKQDMKSAVIASTNEVLELTPGSAVAYHFVSYGIVHGVRLDKYPPVYEILIVIDQRDGRCFQDVKVDISNILSPMEDVLKEIVEEDLKERIELEKKGKNTMPAQASFRLREFLNATIFSWVTVVKNENLNIDVDSVLIKMFIKPLPLPADIITAIFE